MEIIAIIGAGPSGLALAHCLCHDKDKKVIIVDKMGSIGGCHRVTRVPFQGENVFAGHAPRFYSSIFKNFQMLLKDMELDFYEIFTVYRDSFELNGKVLLSTLNSYERVILCYHFMYFLFHNNYGKDISLEEFIRQNGIQQDSVNIIDRIVRLTDGSGVDRYTLNQFFQLFNQQFLYKVYEPKKPLDIGLFNHWKNFLERHNTSFMLNTNLDKIHYNSNTNLIEGITVMSNDGRVRKIRCDKLIIAIPPESIVDVLEKSNNKNVMNSFMNIKELDNFAHKTDYIYYVPIIFHWDKRLRIPKINEYDWSEWGVGFIILSDYMKLNETVSKTVISCIVSYTNVKSSYTNKTANQSTRNEVIEETFRQLRLSLPMLPRPTFAVISPETIYDHKHKEWKQMDEAFVKSYSCGFLGQQGNIPNLMNVGTHNGYSLYQFTSIESAITNAIYLSHKLSKNAKRRYVIQKFWTMTDVIKITLLLIVCALVVLYLLIPVKR